MAEKTTATLIATLGSEPQVVTLTLDHLLGLGEPIRSVRVLHTSDGDGPIASSLQRLRAEFAVGVYPPDLQVEMIELRSQHSVADPLADVDSVEAAQSAFVAIYRAVREEKLAGRRVHLSIAGGRKSASVFGMAAAQMLFDADDKLWHLVSRGLLLEEKRMHALPGEESGLIAIPVISWRAVSPALTDLSEIDNPFEAAAQLRRLQLREQWEKARTFVRGHLTEAERNVVELLVRSLRLKT